jgi:2-keto-4-pentenoate hydratase/2-oxohepta-3-ene-1,7-dioic acid hydratase in catechol pathway
MKIFCIGRNYAEHARELQHEIPKEPVIFMKPKNALLLNNAPFYYPDFTVDLQYECEVVLRICKNGRKVKEKFAHRYYNQLTVGIDFTARDLQARQKEKGLPWEISKSFDHSAALGTLVDIGPEMDLSNLDFSLWKNDEKVQEGNTRDMLFSFNRLVSAITQYFSINIGDFIYTGTPAGVGRVQIGDHLKAYLGDRCLLEFDIR